MPYISIRHGEKDLGWLELDGPVTLGRHRECEICVVDSRLSRMHCRFEREGDDWAAVDLQSRNGTWCDGTSVDRVLLLEGDAVFAGRCVLTFHTGEPPRTGRFEPRYSNRPADPHEALAGTIVGMTVVERPRDPWAAMSGRIRPRPRPMPHEVNLEPRPAETGLLELAAGEEDADLRPLCNLPKTRFLPRPIKLELPDVADLEPATADSDAAPAVVAALAEPESETLGELAAAAPTTRRRRRLNLDFWMFLAVLTIAGAGAWAVWRAVPGF